MWKYTNEQKLEVVLAVLEEGLSQKEAGKLIGACKGDVQKWLNLYQNHGPEGLMLRNGTYDGQFKQHVIEYMHENKLSLRETASKFGIPSYASVRKWERIYYEEGPEALLRENRGKAAMRDDRDEKKSCNPTLDKNVEEDLLAENQRLRMENAYLKKLNALVRERVQRENGKK